LTPVSRFKTAAAYDLSTSYATGGLYAAIVDRPADTAVKAGVCIEGDIDSGIQNELDRLHVMAHLADGFRWARLTGAAVLLLIVEDGGRLSEPLNIAALRHIEEIKVFDATEITPGTLR